MTTSRPGSERGEQVAAQHRGPGCERHKGDPHNLCEACWALEPDRSAANECEHDYSKGHVCLKCGHAETWGEYMKRMEKRYAAYISR